LLDWPKRTILPIDGFSYFEDAWWIRASAKNAATLLPKVLGSSQNLWKTSEVVYRGAKGPKEDSPVF
jgi:hypothetical protein